MYSKGQKENTEKEIKVNIESRVEIVRSREPTLERKAQLVCFGPSLAAV